MKIKKSQLERIIAEEIEKLLTEQEDPNILQRTGAWARENPVQAAASTALIPGTLGRPARAAIRGGAGLARRGLGAAVPAAARGVGTAARRGIPAAVRGLGTGLARTGAGLANVGPLARGGASLGTAMGVAPVAVPAAALGVGLGAYGLGRAGMSALGVDPGGGDAGLTGEDGDWYETLTPEARGSRLDQGDLRRVSATGEAESPEYTMSGETGWIPGGGMSHERREAAWIRNPETGEPMRARDLPPEQLAAFNAQRRAALEAVGAEEGPGGTTVLPAPGGLDIPVAPGEAPADAPADAPTAEEPRRRRSSRYTPEQRAEMRTAREDPAVQAAAEARGVSARTYSRRMVRGAEGYDDPRAAAAPEPVEITPTKVDPAIQTDIGKGQARMGGAALNIPSTPVVSPPAGQMSELPDPDMPSGQETLRFSRDDYGPFLYEMIGREIDSYLYKK